MRTVLIVMAAALLLAGCGSSGPKSAAVPRAQVEKALAGSPPKLAKLHSRANQLVGTSKSDFQASMAALRGYPVVVNKWASWCGPCREEFPIFQKVSVQLGKKVAFLGVDTQDNDGAARTFLKQYPVSYPTYRDPDLKIATSLQAGVAWPTTIFFDKRGKLVYAHPGPYHDAADLIRDIRRYAIA